LATARALTGQAARKAIGRVRENRS
jgi:hypothetical protein